MRNFIKLFEIRMLIGLWEHRATGCIFATYKKVQEQQIEGEEILSSYLKQEWLEAACNKLLRRTFLIENGLIFVSGLLHEDVLWAYHLAKVSKRVRFIQDKGYIYKVREGSITSSKVKKRVDSFILILRNCTRTMP